MNMKRLLVVMSASFALVLATSVPASAAGGVPRDALGIIKAKTGADAVQVTAAQSVGGLTVGTGRDSRTGKALAVSYTQRISATSVRMLAELSDASQTKVDFALTLPAGATVEAAADGSLTITREVVGPSLTAGVSVTEQFGVVAAPWASDANGKALATSYSFANGVLTQSIDTAGATFPVVADPWVTSGWYIYIHFSRQETLNLYHAWQISGTPNEVAYLCGILAPIPGAGVFLAASCGFYITRAIGDINVTVYYAAHNYHKRLVIKLLPPPAPPIYYAGSYAEYAP